MKIVAATVMQMAVYGLLMPAGCILYGMLTGRILPRYALKPRYTGHMRDRGIRRAYADEARAVVYRPAPAYTPYIPQYMLYASGETGLKYLKCEKTPGVRRLSYDVAVFDNRDRLTQVLRVDEETDGTQWTGAVRLPRETSYISLILRRADGARFRDTCFSLSPVGMTLFILLTALLGAGEALFLRRMSCALIEVGKLTAGEPLISAGVTAIAGALIGAVTAITVVLIKLLKLRKVMNT